MRKSRSGQDLINDMAVDVGQPVAAALELVAEPFMSYGGDKEITVIDTTVERFRGGVQLHSVGDVTLENVSVLEAGDIGYDLSAGDNGKVVMKHCRADLPYHPVFNLTRGDHPKAAFYELTILKPPEGTEPTPRTSLGIICGDDCTFILRDGTSRPLPAEGNQLHCGGRHGLTNSTIKNYTPAKLILNDRVRNCVIESLGPVDGGGKDNKITKLELEDK